MMAEGCVDGEEEEETAAALLVLDVGEGSVVEVRIAVTVVGVVGWIGLLLARIE